MPLTRSDLIAITGQITFRDWTFDVGSWPGGEYFLQIVFVAPDLVTGKPAVQKSRKWHLSRHATRSEVVQTAWLAVQTALQHEAREDFRWRGRPLFGPHIDVDAHWEVCRRIDVRPAPHLVGSAGAMDSAQASEA